MARSVERSRRCRPALLVVASVTLSACISKPTEVIVIVNSNAPTSQSVLYRVWARDGVELATARADASASWAQWPGRAANEGLTFAMVPREGGRRDGSFSFRIEATSGGAVTAQTRRAVFTLASTTVVRVALNFDCAQTAEGCRELSVACTVERLCEERGLTCGASGACVPVDDPTEPLDGSLDGAVLSVPPPSSPSDAGDGAVDSGAAVDSGPALDSGLDSCTRNCAGRACGSDRCGGSCGTCAMGQTCNASGQCVAGCTPNCGARACGSDGCGGSCGSCAAPRTCNASGQCTCTPSCPSGRNCGMSDGCGGRCTACPSGLTCVPATGACTCAAGCSGSSANCRDNCGYVNTACMAQCPSNRTCNPTTGNCDCRMSCNGVCCPSGTLYCRGSTCCTDCGRPNATCNIC